MYDLENTKAQYESTQTKHRVALTEPETTEALPQQHRGLRGKRWLELTVSRNAASRNEMKMAELDDAKEEEPFARAA